jgi:hypothetical protein
MAPIDVLYVLYQAVVVAGAGLHWRRTAPPRSGRRFLELLLQWSLVVNVGVAGVVGALSHTVRWRESAATIGWPPGNPFQLEVAAANLAIGVLGLLCARLRGLWWWATAVSSGIFLLGAAVVHVWDILTTGNRAPGNAGAVLYWDVLTPLANVALLVATRGPRAGRPRHQGVARSAAT